LLRLAVRQHCVRLRALLSHWMRNRM